MKKRFLTCALALCMAFLCACGGGSGSQVGGSAAEPPPAPPAPEEELPEELPPEEAVEPEPVPEPVPEPEPEELEPERLEGLIFVSGVTVIGYGDAQTHYEIRCFQPETGKESLISQLDFLTTNNKDYYVPASIQQIRRDMFSDDYSKLAVTKHFVSNGETHAGWIDSDGNFFDVTEALGLQSKSDFDDPASYEALGFSDNLFGYYQYTGKLDAPHYWVPVDNITPSAICEGNVFTRNGPFEDGKIAVEAEPYQRSSYEYHEITSWIDDTRCIVNTSGINSQILDLTEKKTREYIPGDSRENWNGVASPDGTRIAFMSAPLEGSNKVTDVYIIPVEGGNPARVTGYSFVLADSGWSIRNRSPYQEAGGYILIDWK